VGGKYYYLFRAEVEIPLGSGAKEMGIRPSIFLDAGAVWGVKKPTLQDDSHLRLCHFLPTRDPSGNALYYQTNADGTVVTTTNATNTATGREHQDRFERQRVQGILLRRSPRPRIAIGVGFNWNSFGPFRIDIAKAAVPRRRRYQDLQFNVGTQF
jgi:outer membrane protein insertion porin family